MYRMAKHHNVPSALFSVEMSKLQIAQRFLVLESKIDSHKFRRMDRLSEDETRRLLYAADALKDLPIYIDDTPRLSIQELRAKARRACYEHNVKIIFIDYIQLLTGPRFDTRQRELAYISASLKSLAKELDIPVVALSQLSRKVEERKEEEGAPRLSDLRESGALEQEADIVIFLYRPQVEEIVLGEPYREVPIAFSVAKNRNGPQGKFELYFIKEYMQFENIEAVEEREEAEDVLPF
jgi:replicative DNA helicase